MTIAKDVAKAVKNCLDGDGCITCPHKERTACKHFLMRDTLAKLREQETKIKELQEEIAMLYKAK